MRFLTHRARFPASTLFQLNPLSSSCVPFHIGLQKRFAGHNKWSKIKHKKAVADQEKAVKFAKLSLEILSAIKEKGPDPKCNIRLSMALIKAKDACMPKANVESVFKRAEHSHGDQAEDMVYEGYGPGGVAVIVEAVTDNKNRTVKEVRACLAKNSGSMASVGWLFDRKGLIFIEKSKTASFDSIFDLAVEAGAEDVEEIDDTHIGITCPFDSLYQISNQLSQPRHPDFTLIETEGKYIPKESHSVNERQKEDIVKFLEHLESLQDVVKVHHNANL